MPSLNTIRNLTVQHRSEGADRVIADLRGVAAAEGSVGEAATRAATVTEQASRRQLSAASALDREMKKIDASYRATQSQSRATSTFDRALQQGIIDMERRDQLARQADEHYGRMAGGSGARNDNDPTRRGLSSYDKSFIKYQGFDVASSLGSGAGLSTVAFQQGPQVLQQLADREGGLGAGLKQLGQSALGLVTPVTVATAAVASLGIAAGIAATQAGRDREVLEKATLGIGAATGATVSQLNALAVSNAEAGKVSTSTAREIVAGYASLGTIAVPVIGDLTRVTSEYARITGQDTVQATAELGRAFSDVATGADTISAKMGALSDTTRQLIQTQIEQGDRSAAQQTLADSLKASIDANVVSTGSWASAWNTATAAANGYWEAAKRIAGIKLGIAPEGAAEAVARMTGEIDNTNRTRTALGMEPLAPDSRQETERARARVVADQQRMEAEGRAAEERAKQASDAAGRISRAMDPNAARLSELRMQQGTLRDALADPLARGQISDLASAQSAYVATTRAIDTLTDSTGKLIDRQEMSRRGDQLRLDALKATTDAEKAAVAERQKAFDLIGKTITGSDAAEQIKMAGRLSLAGSADKGGSKGGTGSEASDDFDRAKKSLEDRMRRQQQDTQTYGMGAEAVARYRTETDLLTAAKRAERDITPELTAQIKGYADQAGETARAQEQMREAMQSMDQLRSGGRDVFGGLLRDMSHGTTLATTFSNALGKISDRLLDLAAGGIGDALFGKRGSSGAGLFGGLLSFGGSSGSPLAGAQGPSLPAAGGFLASIGKVFGFATGGVMTSSGPLPLHSYATGGIASSPQLALFGEGRGPEAFVPLPDGKRIPVAMSGTAPSSEPASNTDARTFNIDLRGSSLTEVQVKAALDQAISAHDANINRTMGQRIANWRERY